MATRASLGPWRWCCLHRTQKPPSSQSPAVPRKAAPISPNPRTIQDPSGGEETFSDLEEGGNDSTSGSTGVDNGGPRGGHKERLVTCRQARPRRRHGTRGAACSQYGDGKGKNFAGLYITRRCNTVASPL
ncbi:uncharacterized protein BDZ83DRAFT_141571 [Colletotrichum acutatum]|uniref:Uncharacterized protein n=1 Tax=Glomerella acutata TaxID=27357 RepID=A0AAD8URV0_GLOAC|nr:uncharacterized protein BDZ83DRAFT_141571 [Colletotrichum acutatum]KAK1728343.1 hypothetical protein BDZ83DRAFT_141571 [Colletotrichum acutatum]